jgi:hypothetical protein
MDKKKEKLIIAQIICEHCHQSLLNEEETINGNPTIHFKAREKWSENEVEDIFLSAVINNFNKTGHKFEEGTVLELFCPRCKKKFTDHAMKCTSCRERLILLHSESSPLHITGLCPKVGCFHNRTNEVIPSTAGPASN